MLVPKGVLEDYLLGQKQPGRVLFDLAIRGLIELRSTEGRTGHAQPGGPTADAVPAHTEVQPTATDLYGKLGLDPSDLDEVLSAGSSPKEQS